MAIVYFVQHGIASTQEIDENRPLSEMGAAEVYKVADYLKQHQVIINKIYHSGKLRAQQTAVIFSQQLGNVDVAPLNGMNPNDPPVMLIEQLNEDGAMYVGHLPQLQRVAADLTGCTAHNSAIAFKNAGVLCMEINNGCGTIKWFITPQIC